jgi:SNF2 family DNA or RNA helicase
MLLEQNADQLILKYDLPLRSYQRRQFIYYGGRHTDDKTYVFDNQTPTFINKLIAFCEAEDLNLDLSYSVKSIIDKQKNDQKLHNTALKKAGDFKEGIYSNEEYSQHIKFLNKNIKRGLLEHQKKASFHLAILGNGANFSVPGSGKTAVVLSYYEKLKTEGKIDILFVVGPPSCFGPWKDEFLEVLGRDPNESKLAGGSLETRKSIYMMPDDEAELYLTTFQTLQNDYTYVQNMLQKKNCRALLVVDEAHYMKQLDGKWANAVMAIAPMANYRCVLTGTPIPHSYKDLFNIFAFLWQEHSPLSDEDHAHLDVYEKTKDFDKAASLLAPKLGPLFYRVRKKDLGLKPQIMNIIPLNMKPIEGEIYDIIVGNIQRLITEDYLRQLDTIATLRKGRVIRLRQAVSFPKLLISAIEDYHEDVLGKDEDIIHKISKYPSLETPAKLDKLISLVSSYLDEEKKIVIWTNFLGTVELILNTLSELKVSAKKIVGQTPIEKEGIELADTREKIIEEFISTQSGLNVLVANPAACAESISLHKTCHNAIYYDLSFNCAQFLQSLDRIHRVGASEYYSAYYDFLMYENTIDMKIYDNLIAKAERMKALIDQDYSIYTLDMDETDQDISLEELII